MGEESGTQPMLQLAGAGLWLGPFHLCGTAGSAASRLCSELWASSMWATS